MPHIHERIDFTISAFIVYKQDILLIDHKKLHKWLPIGGHIELDEDPEMALFREIEEESALKKSDLEVLSSKPSFTDTGVKFLFTPNYLDIHDITNAHQHIGFIYFLSAKTDSVLLNTEEHISIKWFSKKELGNKRYAISKSIQFYANEAISLVKK